MTGKTLALMKLLSAKECDIVSFVVKEALNFVGIFFDKLLAIRQIHQKFYCQIFLLCSS